VLTAALVFFGALLHVAAWLVLMCAVEPEWRPRVAGWFLSVLIFVVTVALMVRTRLKEERES
jgi:hypothetical protein